MAIDIMQEIIMYEEKAKKIKENAKIFGKEIYEEMVSAAEKHAEKKEQEYKESFIKEYNTLKAEHMTELRSEKEKAEAQAGKLLESLEKHKSALTQSLVGYVLEKG